MSTWTIYLELFVKVVCCSCQQVWLAHFTKAKFAVFLDIDLFLKYVGQRILLLMEHSDIENHTYYKYLGNLPVLWWLMLIGLVNQYSNALFSCQKNSLLLAFNWDSTSALLSVRKNWNDDINVVHLVKLRVSDENRENQQSDSKQGTGLQCYLFCLFCGTF